MHWHELRRCRLLTSNPTKQGLVVTLFEGQSATATGSHGRAVGSSPVGVGAIRRAGTFIRIVVDFLLIIAAGVFGVSGTEDSNGHADDHSKPDQGEHLQRHQEAQEDRFDGAVHADGAVDVLEWVE